MEEIVRLHMPLWGGEALGRLCVRSIAVIVCVIVLGMSASYYGEAYRELSAGEGVSFRSIRNMDVSGESFRKEITFPDIRRSKLLSETKGIPDISARLENIEISERKEPVIPVVSEPAAEKKPEAENSKAVDLVYPDVNDTNTAGEIKVTIYGNGGIPEVSEYKYELDSFSADILDIPENGEKIFEGWYLDEACSIPFEALEEEQRTLVLYAGWSRLPEFIIDEKGFILDDRGYIVGCNVGPETVIDGLLCIPGYAECTGIEKGAFDSVDDMVFDIYISDNITYIAPGAFDDLEYLMYIEVSAGNSCYYSEYGVLYSRNGETVAYPAGRL